MYIQLLVIVTLATTILYCPTSHGGRPDSPAVPELRTSNTYVDFLVKEILLKNSSLDPLEILKCFGPEHKNTFITQGIESVDSTDYQVREDGPAGLSISAEFVCTSPDAFDDKVFTEDTIKDEIDTILRFCKLPLTTVQPKTDSKKFESAGRTITYGRQIGSGTYSTIHLGKYVGPEPTSEPKDDSALKTNVEVVVKKDLPEAAGSLTHEKEVLEELGKNNVPGVPAVFGYDNKNGALAMTYFKGFNLGQLLTLCGGRFTLKTVLALAQIMLELLWNVHLTGYVHRDIKPENFITSGVDDDTVNLIDFGDAFKPNPNVDKHYREDRCFGTIWTMSIEAQECLQQTAISDLRSLGYIFVFFLRGTLLWYHEVEQTKMFATKKSTTNFELCQGYDRVFFEYFEYLDELSPNQMPDHKVLAQRFRTVYIQKGYADDGIMDWTIVRRGFMSPLNSVIRMEAKHRFYIQANFVITTVSFVMYPFYWQWYQKIQNRRYLKNVPRLELCEETREHAKGIVEGRARLFEYGSKTRLGFQVTAESLKSLQDKVMAGLPGNMTDPSLALAGFGISQTIVLDERKYVAVGVFRVDPVLYYVNGKIRLSLPSLQTSVELARQARLMCQRFDGVEAVQITGSMAEGDWNWAKGTILKIPKKDMAEIIGGFDKKSTELTQLLSNPSICAVGYQLVRCQGPLTQILLAAKTIETSILEYINRVVRHPSLPLKIKIGLLNAKDRVKLPGMVEILLVIDDIRAIKFQPLDLLKLKNPNFSHVLLIQNEKKGDKSFLYHVTITLFQDPVVEEIRKMRTKSGALLPIFIDPEAQAAALRHAHAIEYLKDFEKGNEAKTKSQFLAVLVLDEGPDNVSVVNVIRVLDAKREAIKLDSSVDAEKDNTPSDERLEAEKDAIKLITDFNTCGFGYALANISTKEQGTKTLLVLSSRPYYQKPYDNLNKTYRTANCRLGLQISQSGVQSSSKEIAQDGVQSSLQEINQNGVQSCVNDTPQNEVKKSPKEIVIRLTKIEYEPIDELLQQNLARPEHRSLLSHQKFRHVKFSFEVTANCEVTVQIVLEECPLARKLLEMNTPVFSSHELCLAADSFASHKSRGDSAQLPSYAEYVRTLKCRVDELESELDNYEFEIDDDTHAIGLGWSYYTRVVEDKDLPSVMIVEALEPFYGEVLAIINAQRNKKLVIYSHNSQFRYAIEADPDYKDFGKVEILRTFTCEAKSPADPRYTRKSALMQLLTQDLKVLKGCRNESAEMIAIAVFSTGEELNVTGVTYGNWTIEIRLLKEVKTQITLDFDA